MVEIAKAVADQRKILILDEPSAVLSQEELKRLFTLVRQLKEQGTIILYISHRLDEVFEIADRITVLKDGQLVGTVKPQESDQNSLIRMMVGRSLGEIFPVRNLTCRRDCPGGKKPDQEREFFRHLLFAASWRDPGHVRPGWKRADTGGTQHLWS